jgi:glycosyltransferase involved in cell wall biosynthesis
VSRDLACDLVVVSLEAWDAVWRRNQHLVSRLLREDPDLRVLFVEPPADPMHAIRRRTRPGRGAGLRLGPDLPGVASGRLYLLQATKALPRRVDPRVDARLAAHIVEAADRLHMVDPLLWINDPSGATLLVRTGWRSLYDVTDDWLHAGHTETEHARLVADEALLLQEAAHVVVCSPALLAAKSPARNGRQVSLVPNAVDVDAYRNPGMRPADLPAGPVALYLGTVHPDRVDLDLCARTARHLADQATVVLVGPAPLAPTELRGLQEAGVILLGPRNAAEVPAYLTHADVLLVPHVVTPFTDSLDPIKLYEYRVADRPVVSTPVAGFRETQDPRVRLADAQDFPSRAARALASSRRVRRAGKIVTVETPSWDLRAATMRSVLDDVSASRPSRTRPTVAIAHDYLTQRGGAERVVLAMHRAFPDATIYTTLYAPERTYPEFRSARIVTSALNDVRPLRRHHRTALPLLPLAARSMRITEDVVLPRAAAGLTGSPRAGDAWSTAMLRPDGSTRPRPTSAVPNRARSAAGFS